MREIPGSNPGGPTTALFFQRKALAEKKGLRFAKALRFFYKMPVIRVSWWAGRTKEQKEKVVEAITKDITAITGCPKEHVWIIFEDVKKSDWAIGGNLCDK